MPLRVSSIKHERSAVVTIPFAGDEFDVTYWPGVITKDFRSRVNTGDVGALLIELVASWDVVNDDGTPLPLTQEALDILPVDFKVDVLIALLEDHAGGKARGEDSGSG